jgi:hypothetical protein
MPFGIDGFSWKEMKSNEKLISISVIFFTQSVELPEE